MSNYSYKDLNIYKDSMTIADEIWKEVSKWDYFAKDTVGKQLVRAVDSIAANIVEGYGRHHKKDSLLFYYYSRGSLAETRCWLEKANNRKLISDAFYMRTNEVTIRLEKMLNSFISSYRSNNP